MKFDFLSWNFILALLFILLGVSLLGKAIFNFNLPVWKMFFGIIIILIGVKFLIGGNNGRVDFNQASFDASKDKRNTPEYTCLFGKSNIDLSTLPDPDGIKKIEINTVFGSTTLLLNQNIPLKIISSSAFAGVRFPNGTVSSFGTYEYQTDAFSGKASYYLVEINSVFSGTDIR